MLEHNINLSLIVQNDAIVSRFHTVVIILITDNLVRSI